MTERLEIIVTSISSFSTEGFKSLILLGTRTAWNYVLALRAPFTKIVAFVASVDQDQAAQNVLPDLRYIMSAMLEKDSYEFAAIFVLLLDKSIHWVYSAH